MPIIVNELVAAPTTETPPEPAAAPATGAATGDALIDELVDRLAIQRERQERLNID